MKTLSLSEVKMKLSQFIEDVVATDNPISITRNGEIVAILQSKKVYDGWEETLKILRDPTFYKRITGNLQSLDRGEGFSLTLQELFRELNTDATQREKALQRVKILSSVREQMNSIDPVIQRKLLESLQRLRTEDAEVVELRTPLEGVMSLHSGKYKLIYRWRLRTVEIIALDLRETVYREAIRISN